MHTVTLTSDWKADDYYVAALKGSLLSGFPDFRMIDISHRVDSFNINQAAFLIRNSYKYCPAGSIHLCAVTTGSFNGRQLAAYRDGHYFLCADNGMLSLMAEGETEEVVVLDHDGGSFPALETLAPAACALARGQKLSSLGKQAENIESRTPLRPVITSGSISGRIIYLDSYENAISNISKALFEHVGKGRPFEILVQSKQNIIRKLSRHYHDCPPGDLLALFNAAGLLEIAMCEGNAGGLHNLTTRSSIRVEFKDPENA
ncbi:MAG: hypothetical protein CSA96_01075 [Bacteroidetes bacterium]|nr:MAG: hypothetical protein CSA96_01075 [Bacteroidota bacterium]